MFEKKIIVISVLVSSIFSAQAMSEEIKGSNPKSVIETMAEAVDACEKAGKIAQLDYNYRDKEGGGFMCEETGNDNLPKTSSTDATSVIKKAAQVVVSCEAAGKIAGLNYVTKKTLSVNCIKPQPDDVPKFPIKE